MEVKRRMIATSPQLCAQILHAQVREIQDQNPFLLLINALLPHTISLYTVPLAQLDTCKTICYWQMQCCDNHLHVPEWTLSLITTHHSFKSVIPHTFFHHPLPPSGSVALSTTHSICSSTHFTRPSNDSLSLPLAYKLATWQANNQSNNNLWLMNQHKCAQHMRFFRPHKLGKQDVHVELAIKALIPADAVHNKTPKFIRTCLFFRAPGINVLYITCSSSCLSCVHHQQCVLKDLEIHHELQPDTLDCIV